MLRWLLIHIWLRWLRVPRVTERSRMLKICVARRERKIECVPRIVIVALTLSFGLPLSCRPKAPDMTSMPRFVVPFDGLTDGSNPHAEAVPEPNQATTAPEPVPATQLATTADLPDPPAASYSEFVHYELQFSRGDVSVLSVESFRPQNPMIAERRMGRFAFELFVGSELLERVRFDFPLLGATTQHETDPLESGLTTQVRVQIPNVLRATTARVLDRKTRRVVEIAWPPQAPVVRSNQAVMSAEETVEGSGCQQGARSEPPNAASD